ncbi:uncharacterized protein LOC143244215 isoform X2 [Tachypleus tridentatus]|uniref:uncharacterized protein LOC143244215 isoform X2 n=1 Tax=Tachypleus tridentatus TaxID=6853 RepID=UPI003FD5AF0E
MAACFGQDADESVSDENCALHSQFWITSFNQIIVKNVSPTTVMSSTSSSSKNQEISEKSKKETDAALAELREDELQKLLEEAVTFNRPSSEDSYLLQKLKEEHAELCKDVNQHTALKTDVSGACRNRQSRNCVSRTSSKNKSVYMNNFFSCDSGIWENVTKTGETFVQKRTGISGQSREDFIVMEGSKQLKSRSYLDLTDTKSYDPFDVTWSSGKGRRSKGVRVERAKSLSDAPSEVKFLKDSSFPVNRTSDLSCEMISSSLDAKSKLDASKNLDKKLFHIPSSQSDPSSPELGGLFNHHGSSVLIEKQEGTVGIVDLFTQVNSSMCRQELRNSSQTQEFELKEIRKSVEEPQLFKSSLSSRDSHYTRCKSNDGAGDSCSGRVEVDNETAMPCKLLDCNVEPSEKNTDRKIQLEASYGRPQVGGNIINIGIRSSYSILDEGLYLSDQSINKSENKTQKKKKKGQWSDGRILSIDTNGNKSDASELFSSEAHHDRVSRKTKRFRGNADNQNVMLAKDIAGHRWEENIDSLLAYINSSDKKSKGVTYGNNNTLGHSSLSKSSVSQELEKKKDKVTSRDMKNVQNLKNITNVKKISKFNNACNFSRSEDDEHIRNEDLEQSETSGKCNFFNNPFNNFVLERITKTKSLDCTSSGFDINCFDYESQEKLKTSGPKPGVINNSSSSEPVFFHSSSSSGFTKDFYSFAEVSQEPLEETGFRVVVKKKHKKYLPTKSLDGFRTHSHVGGANKYCPEKPTNHNSCSEFVLLNLPLSHRSQRGRQDSSRRKSTSSVPPSEHSSAENSDLDSVHSLPVCSSAPLQTSIHLHNTPSSYSSTLQASYADITRMSVISSGEKVKSSNKLSENDPNTIFCLPPPDKNFGLEFGIECNLVDDTFCSIKDNQSGGITDLVSKSSNQDPQVLLSSLSDTNFVTKSFKPLVGVENLSIPATPVSVPVCSTKTNKLLISNQVKPPEKRIYMPSKRNCAFQEFSKERDKLVGVTTELDSECPPVVIMDNYAPGEHVCDLTFGFEVNEQLLRMSLGENYVRVVTSLGSHLQICPDIYSTEPNNDKCATSNCIGRFLTGNTNFSEDFQPCSYDGVITLSGRLVRWRESPVNVDTFNYDHIVQFFGMSWEKVLNDYNKGCSKNSTSNTSRVRYYTELVDIGVEVKVALPPNNK